MKARVLLFVTLFVLFISGVSTAESPKWYQLKVSNGITMYACNTSSNFVGVTVTYPFGANADPEGMEGMAHLAEHTTFLSLAESKEKPVDFYVRDLGGVLGAKTGFFQTKYYWSLPASEILSIAHIEMQRMTSFNVTNAAFETEKAVVCREIADEGALGSNGFSETIATQIIGKHRGIGGTVDSVSAISYQDVAEFVRNNYTSNGVVITVCGGIDPGRTLCAYQDIFLKAKAGTAPKRAGGIASARLIGDPNSSSDLLLYPLPKEPEERVKAVLIFHALFGISGSEIVRGALATNGRFRGARLLHLQSADRSFECVSIYRKHNSSSSCGEGVLKYVQEAKKSGMLRRLLSASKNTQLAQLKRTRLVPLALSRSIDSFPNISSYLDYCTALEEVSVKELEKTALSIARAIAALNPVIGNVEGREGEVEQSRNLENLPVVLRDVKEAIAFDRGEKVYLSGRASGGIAAFSVVFNVPSEVEGVANSRAVFHSWLGDQPNTFKLEELGWKWQIGESSWCFWGLEESLLHAINEVLDILENKGDINAEISLQYKLVKQNAKPLDRIRQHMRSRLVSDRTMVKMPDIRGYYNTRNASFFVVAPHVNNALRLTFSRRFGKAIPVSKLPSPSRDMRNPGKPKQGEEITDSNVSGAGMCMQGPLVDSPQYLDFLMLTGILADSDNLASLVSQELRGLKGLSYWFSSSMEIIDGRACFLVYAIGKKGSSAPISQALKNAVSRLGNWDESLPSESIVYGSFEQKLKRFSDDPFNALLFLPVFSQPLDNELVPTVNSEMEGNASIRKIAASYFGRTANFFQVILE